MNRLWLLFLMSAIAFSQAEVTISQKPEASSWTQILHNNGTVIDYTCTALSLQPPTQITVSTVSNANPGSFTATAHGMYFNAASVTAKVVIFISGATGGWTGINGTFVATPTSANAFTIPVDTSGFGSFSGQSIVVTTRAPLTTKSVWSVQSLVNDSNNLPVFIAWAANSTTTGLGNLGSGSTRPTTCTAPAAFQ